MGTKNNPGDFDCYERALPDEPMFVLLARDAQASVRVRDWAAVYKDKKQLRREWTNEAIKKYEEAIACAKQMDEWRDRQTEGADE